MFKICFFVKGENLSEKYWRVWIKQFPTTPPLPPLSKIRAKGDRGGSKFFFPKKVWLGSGSDIIIPKLNINSQKNLLETAIEKRIGGKWTFFTCIMSLKWKIFSNYILFLFLIAPLFCIVILSFPLFPWFPLISPHPYSLFGSIYSPVSM